MKNLEVQLVWPPFLVRRATAGCGFARSARYWALAIFIHFSLLLDLGIYNDNFKALETAIYMNVVYFSKNHPFNPLQLAIIIL